MVLTNINFSHDEFVVLKNLAEQYPKHIKRNIIIQRLMDKLEAHTIEILLRNAIFYGLTDVEDKKKREQIFKIAAQHSKIVCKCRADFLNLGFDCPEALSDFFFCIYKMKANNETVAIRVKCDQLKNSKKVRDYLKKSEKLFQGKSLIEGKFLNTLFNKIFVLPVNRKISFELSNLFGEKIIKNICHLRNMIDDSCPIIIKDILTEQESRLVEFITNSGDIVDYIMLSAIEPIEVPNLLESLKKKYSAETTEHLIILNLIEQHYRKVNLAYINMLLNLNILKAIKNVEHLYKLIDSSKKFQFMRLKRELKSLIFSVGSEIEEKQYRKLMELIMLVQEHSLL